MVKKLYGVSFFVMVFFFAGMGIFPQLIQSRSPHGDATTPLALELSSTIRSGSVVAPFLGDDNGNNSATVYYRRVDSLSYWQEGHVMAVDRPAREWRVSLFYLAPDASYEVEVRYEDADGVSPATVSGTLRTRPDYPDTGSGTIRTVPTDGDLRAVINDSEPGDTVQLLSDVYYEGEVVLNSSHSGAPGQYITIEPAPGATVVLDGSDPDINSEENDWRFYASSSQGNIYYTDLPWGSTNCEDLHPGYVGELIDQKGTRYLMFDSGTDDWADDFLAAPPGKSFYVCDDSGPGPERRLYVVTYSKDDPDDHEMHVSRYERAFNLVDADYIRIRGMEFRYYSWNALCLTNDDDSGADHNIIEDNVFHGIGQYHVRLRGADDRKLVSNNLIQNNYFYEGGYRESLWKWSTQYFDARGGIVNVLVSHAGGGNVVRGNRFDGGHDGVHVNRGTPNTDVYDNTFSECMDDAIEVDNDPGQNIRVWNNMINYCYVSISIQDWNAEHHGPVYIFRNVIIAGEDPQGRTDYSGGRGGYISYTAFKVGSDIEPDGWAYIYHNTTFLLRPKTAGNGIHTGGGRHFANVVTRNNIWHVTGEAFRLETSDAVVNHDFDCDNIHDLDPSDDEFIRWSSSGGPRDDGTYRDLSEFQTHVQQEMRAISDASTMFDPEMRLKWGSPDIDAGCIIQGFNGRGPNAYLGSAPDMGAFEYVSDFNLSAKPLAQAVEPGGTANYILSIEPEGDFTHTVTLVAASLSPSVTLDFYPGTLTLVSPGQQALLTLTDHHTGTLQFGSWHTAIVTGTGGDRTHTVTLGLMVGGKQVYLPLILKAQP